MPPRNSMPQLLGGALLFGAGVLSAQTWLSLPPAVAQSSKPSTPQAFLAADERTEPVIREILATIKRIDGRLERIEKSVTLGDRSDAPATTPSRGRSR